MMQYRTKNGGSAELPKRSGPGVGKPQLTTMERLYLKKHGSPTDMCLTMTLSQTCTRKYCVFAMKPWLIWLKMIKVAVWLKVTWFTRATRINGKNLFTQYWREMLTTSVTSQLTTLNRLLIL